LRRAAPSQGTLAVPARRCVAGGILGSHGEPVGVNRTPAISTREFRARLLEIARRRQKPGTGSSHEFLRRRTAMKQWPDLTDTLGDVPWATVGGVAIRQYAPERATVDLDLLIERSTAPVAREHLREAGLRYDGELPVGGSTWYTLDGTAIDVLESDEPWVRAALDQAKQNRDLQGLPILPLPYFILMKLRSGRTIDIGDVTRILGLAGDADLDAVRSAIRQFEPEALEDVESMIVLGRMEMQ
jgi:hypothetical protein